MTLDSVLTHGVDIQLKVLQTILSVLTYCTDVHGEVLGDVSLHSSLVKDSGSETSNGSRSEETSRMC